MSVLQYLTDTKPEYWIVFIVVAILSYYWMTKKHYKLPPMPHSLPIVGNLFSLPVKESLFVVSKRWSDEIKEPVIRLRLGTSDGVVLNDFKSIHEALSERSDDFAGRAYNAIFAIVSGGFEDVAFTDASPEWKAKRKILVTALRTFSVGEAFEERVFTCFDRVAEILDQKVESQEAFNPTDCAKLFVYNYMAAVCYKKVFKLDDKAFIEIRDGFVEGSKLFGKNLSIDNFPLLKYLPFKMPDLKAAEGSFSKVTNYNLQAIAEHIADFDAENVRDFTDNLLKAKYEAEAEEKYTILTEKHLALIVNDVFAAGIATQPSIVIWFYHQMAMHQDVQQKVYREIKDVLGDDMIKAKDRARLPYTEATMLECIRFSTITTIGLPRKTLVDTQVGGYDIPKGTVVFPNHGGIHFDPENFEEPWEFKPERFLQNNICWKPKCFIPFGLGRRACAGEVTARPTLFLMLALLVIRYKLKPAPGETLTHDYEQDQIGCPVPFKIVLEHRE